MKYSDDFDIYTFEFWSGAHEVIEYVSNEDLLEDAQRLIEKRFEGETPTATQINHYVRFYLKGDLQAIYGKSLWPED